MSSSLSSCFIGSSMDEAKSTNKRIDEQLKIAKKMQKSQIKLLVLGAAESGKSTFIKQMQIIHGKGYSNDEKQDFKSNIHHNIFTAVRLLSYAMTKLEIEYEKDSCQEFGKKFLHHHNHIQHFLASEKIREDINLQFAINVKKFWKDRGVQKCYKRRNEFHLLDSASYFLNDVERILEPGYFPNLQDILHSRNPTAGICEYVFEIDKFIFGMIDVGGQKSERRKWIHCFDNVNSIIFLAALSEYDQTIPQDEIDQNEDLVANSNASQQNNVLNKTSKKTLSYDNMSSSPKKKAISKTYSQQTLNVTNHNSATRSRNIGGKFQRSARGDARTKLPPFPEIARQTSNDDFSVNVNRMRESFCLFKTLVHSKWFKDTSVILFLNKTDILNEKIQYSDLVNYDETYEGPSRDSEAAKTHILEKYIKGFHHPPQGGRLNKRTLYSHFTCATDTNNIRFVFAAIKDIILQNYLENYNLI